MQNILIAMLQWVLRYSVTCLRHVTGVFVLPPTRGYSIGLGVFSVCVDLDSARLDVVSRSLLWGAGVRTPDPAAVCSPNVIAPGPLPERVSPDLWRRFDA